MDPTGCYENLVTIRSFKPEFRLAGGLNLPKIIDCVGSDGKERRQLVKVSSVSCNDISETWHVEIFLKFSCQFSPVSLLYLEQTFHSSVSVFSVQKCFNKGNYKVIISNIKTTT